MPFEILRNDITNMCVDAIVNTANPKPAVGAGTDAAVHAKAGPELLEARKKLGDIQAGCSGITAGYGLHAKYVIHTVGPVWRGGLFGEAKLLRSCYDSALALALENHCRSVAFPLISTGNYGFPKDKALQIAVSAFSAFLTAHEMQIYLVVFDRNSFRLSEKLFHSVASYIDENYVQLHKKAAYGTGLQRNIRRRDAECSSVLEEANSCRPMAAAMPGAASLEDMLRETDAGFTETLLKLIDKTGRKDSEIYSKANVSRQHFSKIRNNLDYRPTKATALAFAIALELDLDQTRDLIGRAGYALTNSSKFDVIIRYFIEHGNYDMMQINTTLFEFDQSLLGA